MMGASIAQTQVLQKALRDATHAGGALVLDAVQQSVGALKQGFAEAETDHTPVDPALTTAAVFDVVLALLADIRAEHAKSK